VREVSHGDFPLLIHCGEERTFVVDAKVEDTVLVRQGKRCAEDGAVGGIANGFEVETVERREHSEF